MTHLRPISALFAALLALTGCSGGEATSGTSSASGGSAKPVGSTKPSTGAQASSSAKVESPSGEAAIAVGPMKATVDGKALELKDDGAYTIDGKPAGKFSKNRLELADGKHAITVAKDGAVTIDADLDINKIGVKFNDKNNLTTAEKGDVLQIEDDGKVTLKGKDVHPAFTGFKPELRRAANLMMLVFMIQDELAHLPAGAAPSASASAK